MLRLDFNKEPLETRRPRGYTAGMSWLLAAVLLSASARAQAPAQKANVAPRSGRWGMDYRKKVQSVFDKLLAASGYDSPAALAKDHRDPTFLRYYDGDRTVAGSPAVALAARTGLNKENRSIVIVTYGALEIGDEDHLAFFLGHEIAHLVHGHPQQLVKVQGDLFDKWYDANSARLAEMKPEAVADLFGKEKGAELQALAKPLEREADVDGMALMTLAGYDAKAAGDALDRAQDWTWALRWSGDDPSHDPLVERAAALRSFTGQMEAADRATKRVGTILPAKPN